MYLTLSVIGIFQNWLIFWKCKINALTSVMLTNKSPVIRSVQNSKKKQFASELNKNIYVLRKKCYLVKQWMLDLVTCKNILLIKHDRKMFVLRHFVFLSEAYLFLLIWKLKIFCRSVLNCTCTLLIEKGKYLKFQYFLWIE